MGIKGEKMCLTSYLCTRRCRIKNHGERRGRIKFEIQIIFMSEVIFTNEVDVVLQKYLRTTGTEQVFILMDRGSKEHCIDFFPEGLFNSGYTITIASGEQYKSLESASEIWSILTAHNAKRNSVLVNIGGGIVTDVGGFAASCFKRGMRYINIPTTLLAQVDASIGGKTGINYGGYKNEIGTFSTPECVIIDNRFLKTLSKRHILSGFAEMLKHALLSEAESLMELLDIKLDQVDSTAFLQMIKDSVTVKEAIVKADPREKGIRRALNFGHTVGHAIESVAIANGVDIHHGDAVAYGMVAELYLSVKKLDFDTRYYEALKDFVGSAYPSYSPVAGTEELYGIMLNDKKNERKGVNFTLLHNPGEFETDVYCTKNEIYEALAQLGHLTL